jgi:nitroreductase
MAMDFQQVVNRRRMVRNFGPEPVDAAVLDRILDNALHAPSAGFSQGWAFLRLDTADDVGRFWEATTPDEAARNRWYEGMRRAPAIVVPLSHKDAYLDRYTEPDKGWADRDEGRWPVPYWHIDTGMAALLMLLTVVDEGLGSCFFGIPPERTAAFRGAFAVPEEYVPIGAIAIGHRRSDVRSPSLERGRRTAAEVVHHHRW